jgi:hypothetical protein
MLGDRVMLTEPLRDAQKRAFLDLGGTSNPLRNSARRVRILPQANCTIA